MIKPANNPASISGYPSCGINLRKFDSLDPRFKRCAVAQMDPVRRAVVATPRALESIAEGLRDVNRRRNLLNGARETSRSSCTPRLRANADHRRNNDYGAAIG